jgi:dTDP-4-dehydrorhamnose reductase
MKVFVTGGSGMIGSKFVDKLGEKNEVLYTYLSREALTARGRSVKLNITDRASVLSEIEDFAPDLTIHCSALTKVDLCEINPKLADDINVTGTKNVVDACSKVGSKIIYISTSFVFDGKKKVYHEDDKPHTINQYGLTKLKGEEVIKKSGQPFMILRTDHPYRWSSEYLEKNNVMRMIGFFERGEKFREATDWFNMPTLVDNFVEVSMKLIKKWEDGTYQIVGSDYISRYDMAMKIAAAVKGDKDLVQKVKSSVFNLQTKRPNVHMSNDKVQEKTGVRMLGLEDGVKILLSQREASN